MDKQLLAKLYPFNGTAIRADHPDQLCLIHLDDKMRVIRASGVSCAYEGTPKFNPWFRKNYPSRLLKDGGERYYQSREIAVEAA